MVGGARDSPLVNPHPLPGLQPEERLLPQELERNQVMGKTRAKGMPLVSLMCKNSIGEGEKAGVGGGDWDLFTSVWKPSLYKSASPG